MMFLQIVPGGPTIALNGGPSSMSCRFPGACKERCRIHFMSVPETAVALRTIDFAQV
jgi:hypothetical protein